ncbi:hypothetical protein ACFO3D_12290 [Virgibacillus kekensis]|uniref:DNA-binding protein n=1 Tax=Virgibacillus kekensis TaxID=202261 RepID=A0ABV9DKQ5_9BACI
MNYTEEQLSQLVGVSSQAMIAIESGKYKPGARHGLPCQKLNHASIFMLSYMI